MYFSEGLMLVKVETRHNGDTRTPRKYRTKKNLSANMSACEDTDKETHKRGRLDERRGVWKEEHLLCANTRSTDMSIRFYVDDTVRKTFGGEGRTRDGNSLSETP